MHAWKEVIDEYACQRYICTCNFVFIHTQYTKLVTNMLVHMCGLVLVAMYGFFQWWQLLPHQLNHHYYHRHFWNQDEIVGTEKRWCVFSFLLLLLEKGRTQTSERQVDKQGKDTRELNNSKLVHKLTYSVHLLKI